MTQLYVKSATDLRIRFHVENFSQDARIEAIFQNEKSAKKNHSHTYMLFKPLSLRELFFYLISLRCTETPFDITLLQVFWRV